MAHLISDLILVQDVLLKTTDPDESWSMRSHGVTSHSVVDSTEVLIDKGGASKLDDNEENDEIGSFGCEAASELSASIGSLQLEEVQRRGSGYDSRRIGIPSGVSTLGKGGSFSSEGQHSHTTSDGSSYRMKGMQISDEVADARWRNALNMVMRMEPRAFATELTRMQWELFLDIRVSLGAPLF